MATRYRPPVRDILFALRHLGGLPGLAELGPYRHADLATVEDVLKEFGRFAAEVIAPSDAAGDRQGVSLDVEHAIVRTADGFAAAYQRYVNAGWGSVPFPEANGGGGFPRVVGLAMQEILTSASMSFALCPMLTQGAIEMILTHGTPQQVAEFIPPLVSGAWTGTMNLTEPQAGSDVGALTTRAEPEPDGSWRITGQKTFVTYGDHDMAENIVHLVLARVPGAPQGTRGISCFIVPKYLPAFDGGEPTRNAVTCIGLEHKLGIHASPTCTLDFRKAVGHLVGEPNDGMRHMFTMMNNARLSVGLQGLAVGEVAYQQAHAYAADRVQGRVADGRTRAIIEHPDVRRMLFTMRSLNEAMRGLLYFNAECIDRA